jgi:membrane fusion protein (multidrug efflux system)
MKLKLDNDKRMKNIIKLSLLSAILVACNQTEVTPLEELYQERDSLSQVQNRVSERLRTIEEEIIALDSTRRLTTITTMTLKSAPFDHFFQVYGTIEASKSISIFPETSGIIKRIAVDEGQQVAAGQLLLEMDGKIIEKNINEVETSLDLATTLYEKQKKLWLEEKIGSEVQYLQAKNNKESLESRLATLREQLRMTKIRAPFSGVVDDIFPKEGEMASTAMAVLRLVNLSDVYINADVSEAYVGRITKGTKANVYLRNLDKTFESEVVQVGQFINPANRTFRVQIAVNEETNLLKPNMMASVSINDYHTDNAITVPNSLIQQTPDGQNFVYVARVFEEEFGEIERVMVEIGMSHDNVTEVTSGLQSTDILVNKGSRSVQRGQRVRIVEG